MMNRRDFTQKSLLAGAAAQFFSSNLDAQSPEGNTENGPPARREICAFIKFVQSLPYDELGKSMIKAGFDGVEATIRKGGIIEPEAVADELPKLAATLAEHGCKITLMATDINRADHALTEKVLRAAADVGVKRYRTAYYTYDLAKSIRPQLANFHSTAKDLAALNKSLGLTGVYQNHAGAKNAGASIWDLDEFLADIDPDDLGVAFDIRHATAEGGTTWPLLWKLISPRVRTIYVKDLVWKDRQPHNVPLGEGLVSPKFAQQIKSSPVDIPVSVHVEYLEKDGIEENVAALRNDRATLERWLR
ncbi:MAG: TIM barrel protein [Verrucomicrobiales bacterium]